MIHHHLQRLEIAKIILATVLFGTMTLVSLSNSAEAQTGTRIKGGKSTMPGQSVWMDETGSAKRVDRLLARGKNEEALEVAEELVRRMESSLNQANDLRYYYGKNAYCAALLANGRSTAALDACNRATKIAPDRWEAFNNLGSAYLLAGKPEDAIATYDHALSLKSGSKRKAKKTIQKNLEIARAIQKPE